MRGVLGLAALAALAFASGAAADGVKVTGLTGPALTLSAADIAALPRTPLTLKLEGGKSEACEGAALSDILAKVGAPQGHALRGPEMADVVEIGAADGYHVALALAETDPGMKTTRIILADRCDGAALSPAEGPFRLVVDGDLRPARSARQVTSITVLRLPTAP